MPPGESGGPRDLKPVLARTRLDAGFSCSVSARIVATRPPAAHFASADLPAADRETQRRFQDAANNRLLIERLQGSTDRRARFVSTLVAVRSADDPEPLIAVGRWHGEILQEAVGTGGFGYDPLMFIPALGLAVAELGPELKNAHSHRALAARQMLALMRDAWHLG